MTSVVGSSGRCSGVSGPGVAARVDCARQTFTEQVAQLPAGMRTMTRLPAALAGAVEDGRDQSEVAVSHEVSWPTVQRAVVAHGVAELVEPESVRGHCCVCRWTARAGCIDEHRAPRLRLQPHRNRTQPALNPRRSRPPSAAPDAAESVVRLAARRAGPACCARPDGRARASQRSGHSRSVVSADRWRHPSLAGGNFGSHEPGA